MLSRCKGAVSYVGLHTRTISVTPCFCNSFTRYELNSSLTTKNQDSAQIVLEYKAAAMHPTAHPSPETSTVDIQSEQADSRDAMLVQDQGPRGSCGSWKAWARRWLRAETRNDERPSRERAEWRSLGAVFLIAWFQYEGIEQKAESFWLVFFLVLDLVSPAGFVQFLNKDLVHVTYRFQLRVGCDF